MSWLTEPDEDWDDQDTEPRSRAKLISLIVGGWLVVSVVVLVVLLSFNGRGSSQHDKTNSGNSATPGTSATSSAVSLPVPDGWVQQAADDQTDCAAHSYGKVKTFFATTPCSSVRRSLATTTQAGRQVVVASYVITFGSAAHATQYQALVTADGTGNINDLLREGKTYRGAPSQLPAAAFASRMDGTRVFVAEAAYTDGKSDGSDPALVRVAKLAIAPS